MLALSATRALFLAALLATVLSTTSVIAGGHNHHEHQHEHTSSSSSSSNHPGRRQIAIIGAGPSGTSAAYWLYKAQQKLQDVGRGSDGFDIHLYEKEERIGGRTKVVHPFDDDSYPTAELGASIFADVNRNMARFTKLFDFPATAKIGEADATTGIWDGREFVLDDLSGNWWSSAKIFWRYGYSPITVNNIINDLVAKFIKLYDPKFLHQTTGANSNSRAHHSAADHNKTNTTTRSGYPWESVESLTDTLDFSEPASVDADDWFYGNGVSRLFTREVIEAATRVNYAQNVDQIHAIGAGVSLAASGAAGVKGGNYRLFEEMLKRSGAKMHLGNQGEVTGIVKFNSRSDAEAAGRVAAWDAQASSQGPKWWVGTAAGTGGLYDAVFVGAPWQNAGITLMGTESVIPTTKYVHLYVTLAVTNASHPDPTYFGRGKGSTVPKTIMTTYNAVRQYEHRKENDESTAPPGTYKQPQLKVVHSGLWYWWDDMTRLFGRSSSPKQVPLMKPTSAPNLEFLSLNYITNLGPRRTRDSHGAPPHSNAPDDHLVKIFSLSPLSDAKLETILGQGTIGWIYRQQWDSYPELHPTRSFPPIRPDQGLYYMNALEPLVSTMETSTVSSRNAVALLLEQWYGLEFVTGKDCQFKMYTMENDDREGWDGWGCNAA